MHRTLPRSAAAINARARARTSARSETPRLGPIRVAVADNCPLILRAIDQLLGQFTDFKIVARCADAAQTMRAVREHLPEILVLDTRLTDDDGFDVLRKLSSQRLPVRTVLFTSGLGDDQILRAMRLGVAGIVMKHMSPELLVTCIRNVHAGKMWIERDAMTGVMGTVLKREVALQELQSLLTAREFEIMRKVVGGLRNKHVSDELHISEGTVKVHLSNIYQKLNVDGRMALMVTARKLGVA